MKNSTLLAGLLALLIACGISFGAGYYVAKEQAAESPTPKTQVSDLDGEKPRLDSAPLTAPEQPAEEEGQPDKQPKPSPDVTPDSTAKDNLKPAPVVVDADKPAAPAEKDTAPADQTKGPQDEISNLKDKLKDVELVKPEDFEDIFNGPKVDFTATISGMVVDQAGTPVAGAGVHANYSENYSSGEGRVSFVMARAEGKGEKIATTDASGSFSATITRKISEKASLQVSMTATADTYAESEKSSFALKNGDDKQGIKLALRGAGSVSGRVVDANGRGVGGVKVGLNTGGGSDFGEGLYVDYGGQSSKHSATTDAAGEFNIEGVPEARYKFRLSGAGYRQISGPTEIDVKAGQAQRAPADFQVAVTAVVTAKFVTQAGEVNHNWISLEFKDDSGKVVKRLNGMASDGVFEKNDPPTGTFDVKISAWGFKPHTVRATVTEGQRCDLGTITLEPAEEGEGSIVLPGDE